MTLDAGKDICSADRAAYLRKVIKQGEAWHVEDYYAFEKTEEMEGNYLDSGLTIEDGMFYWYYPKGMFKGKGRYANGKKQGTWRHYYENGALSDSSYFRANMPCRFAYEWDEDGKITSHAVLNDSGAGYETGVYSNGSVEHYGKYQAGHKKDSTWTWMDENNRISQKVFFKSDSILKSEYYTNGILDASRKDHWPLPQRSSWSYEKGEMIYHFVDVWPEAPYDINAYLAATINYPLSARNRHAEGRVNVQFVIDENGNIIKVHSLTSKDKIDESLIDEAVRVVKTMPKWTPGRLHNRPVKVYFVLPVSFKIS